MMFSFGNVTYFTTHNGSISSSVKYTIIENSIKCNSIIKIYRKTLLLIFDDT